MLSACSTPVSSMSGQSLHCCRSFTLSISGGTEKWRCFGKRNLIFMSIMLGALIAFPPIWREVAIGGCAIMSYYWTPARIHEANAFTRSEEHTSELQSPCNIVCRLLLE